VDGAEDVDVVVESMELIRCYLKEDFVARWDYQLENPRRDMRGFEVDELLNDQDETVHLQRDRHRKIRLKDLKSDLIISNGARLYNDHTHPEYSTPECHSLFDLVALDRAGERILLHCARRRTASRGRGVVRLFKNNTDFEEHSYGCHENFLLPRQLPFQQVIEGLVPFLVTRQLWAGAGKVGVECAPQERQSIYQLSQRADFFEVLASVDTMTRRPLVNTRDEPHANADQHRRLHLIVGDANMSEWATALKVGACALVLDLLETGTLPRWEMADPVAAIKILSRDQSRQWVVALAGGTHASALEIQRSYLDASARLAAGRDPETDWVLAQWEEALDALGRDPLDLLGRCDWVTKKWLLDTFAQGENLDWENPDHRVWLQSQDLEYHNIDPEEGLYLLLEAQGQVTQLVEEQEILQGMTRPPTDTRAYFRGRCLEKFGAAVRSLNWDSIEFSLKGRTRVVDLKACVDAGVAAYYNQVLDSAPSVEALLEKLPTSA
jgi:proteasome accessory factor A